MVDVVQWPPERQGASSKEPRRATAENALRGVPSTEEHHDPQADERDEDADLDHPDSTRDGRSNHGVTSPTSTHEHRKVPNASTPFPCDPTRSLCESMRSYEFLCDFHALSMRFLYGLPAICAQEKAVFSRNFKPPRREKSLCLASKVPRPHSFLRVSARVAAGARLNGEMKRWSDAKPESAAIKRGLPTWQSSRAGRKNSAVKLPAPRSALLCRVALGGCPPRAPTDPYVDALDHTVPQGMGSLLDV